MWFSVSIMASLKINKRFRQFLPVIIDIETSGLDDEKHAILEVAAVFLEYDNTLLKPYRTLHFHVLPFRDAQFDPQAMEIHNIKPDHPFRMAVDETTFLSELNQDIEKELVEQGCRKAILTGHNPSFDLGFLLQAGKRCKIKPSVHSFSTFDTATLSALTFGQTVLARALSASGIKHDVDEAHSALYDAEQTAKLFCHIVNHSQFNPLETSNLPYRKYRHNR